MKLLYHLFKALPYNFLKRQIFHVYALHRNGDILLRIAQHCERRCRFTRFALPAHNDTGLIRQADFFLFTRELVLQLTRFPALALELEPDTSDKRCPNQFTTKRANVPLLMSI